MSKKIRNTTDATQEESGTGQAGKLVISKEDFERYVRVQMSGVTNMMDVKKVTLYSGLSREQILYIMEHYIELEEKYSQVK